MMSMRLYFWMIVATMALISDSWRMSHCRVSRASAFPGVWTHIEEETLAFFGSEHQHRLGGLLLGRRDKDHYSILFGGGEGEASRERRRASKNKRNLAS